MLKDALMITEVEEEIEKRNLSGKLTEKDLEFLKQHKGEEIIDFDATKNVVTLMYSTHRLAGRQRPGGWADFGSPVAQIPAFLDPDGKLIEVIRDLCQKAA